MRGGRCCHGRLRCPAGGWAGPPGCRGCRCCPLPQRGSGTEVALAGGWALVSSVVGPGRAGGWLSPAAVSCAAAPDRGGSGCGDKQRKGGGWLALFSPRPWRAVQRKEDGRLVEAGRGWVGSSPEAAFGAGGCFCHGHGGWVRVDGWLTVVTGGLDDGACMHVCREEAAGLLSRKGGQAANLLLGLEATAGATTAQGTNRGGCGWTVRYGTKMGRAVCVCGGGGGINVDRIHCTGAAAIRRPNRPTAPVSFKALMIVLPRCPGPVPPPCHPFLPPPPAPTHQVDSQPLPAEAQPAPPPSGAARRVVSTARAWAWHGGSGWWGQQQGHAQDGHGTARRVVSTARGWGWLEQAQGSCAAQPGRCGMKQAGAGRGGPGMGPSLPIRAHIWAGCDGAAHGSSWGQWKAVLGHCEAGAVAEGRTQVTQKCARGNRWLAAGSNATNATGTRCLGAGGGGGWPVASGGRLWCVNGLGGRSRAGQCRLGAYWPWLPAQLSPLPTTRPRALCAVPCNAVARHAQYCTLPTCTTTLRALCAVRCAVPCPGCTLSTCTATRTSRCSSCCTVRTEGDLLDLGEVHGAWEVEGLWSRANVDYVDLQTCRLADLQRHLRAEVGVYAGADGCHPPRPHHFFHLFYWPPPCRPPQSCKAAARQLPTPHHATRCALTSPCRAAPPTVTPRPPSRHVLLAPRAVPCRAVQWSSSC